MTWGTIERIQSQRVAPAEISPRSPCSREQQGPELPDNQKKTTHRKYDLFQVLLDYIHMKNMYI